MFVVHVVLSRIAVRRADWGFAERRIPWSKSSIGGVGANRAFEEMHVIRDGPGCFIPKLDETFWISAAFEKGKSLDSRCGCTLFCFYLLMFCWGACLLIMTGAEMRMKRDGFAAMTSLTYCLGRMKYCRSRVSA